MTEATAKQAGTELPQAEEQQARLEAMKHDIAEIARVARTFAGDQVQRARQNYETAETWAGHHPAATLGVGIGVGFLIGLVLGRATK